MNDPRYHPYSGNGYRGFVASPRGRPVARFPGHGVGRALGRRMGHLPHEMGCTGVQGGQQRQMPGYSGPTDTLGSRLTGTYSGSTPFIEGQGFPPRHMPWGMSPRGSPGRSYSHGRHELRGGYTPAKSQQGAHPTHGLLSNSQPTRRGTGEPGEPNSTSAETLSTRRGTGEPGEPNSTSAETLSSKTSTNVSSPEAGGETKQSSTKDECVQTSGQISPFKQSFGLMKTCTVSTTDVTGDKQTAKIQPFNHSPPSTCTQTVPTSVSTPLVVSSLSGSETSHTTVAHVSSQSDQQSSQQGVPTSNDAAEDTVRGTTSSIVMPTCPCICQSRHRFKQKYGDKGKSTCDPIVIDSDDEKSPDSDHVQGVNGSMTSPTKKRAKMSANHTQGIPNTSSSEVQTHGLLSGRTSIMPPEMEHSVGLSLASVISERLRHGRGPVSSNSSSSSGSSSSISSTSSIHISEDAPLLANPEIINCMLKEAKQDRPGKKLRLTARNLFMAAKCCNIPKILGLLGEGCNPNQQVEQEKGKSAMHAAAAGGYIDVLSLLRLSKGDFNILDHSRRTPIFDAIENHKIRAVKYLIEAGAELRARDEDGMTALHVAARRGHTDIISLLCNSAKFDINQQDKGGWTAIMWSADDKHIEATRYLIELGANIHLRDLELNTPLHWAACAGVLDVSEILLNHNADLNWQNEHGDTVLHIAAREGHYTCVQLYSNRGARLDIKNKHGETPVEVAPEGSRPRFYLETKRQMMACQGPHKFKFLCSDLSRGRESVSITCINEVDDEPLVDFNYVMNSCEVNNVHVDCDIKSLQSCDCEDSCRSGSCSCGQRGDGERIWYKWCDELGSSVLQNGINKFDRPLVYECNRMCKCWSYCQNRVVQKGMKFPLQVYRTQRKGWGVRSLGPIPQGAFVCEYSGEWISDAEAESRLDDSYLFDLDCKENEDELYCIDAKTYGSIGRFINHSCEPNVNPVRVFIEHQDIRFPRIALFASRNIEMYGEICFNYGDRFWEVKKKEFHCKCGIPSCKYKGPPEKS